MGATYIERHFTLNRTWKGTDHAASLEPDGMRRVARDLRNAYKALTYKPKEVLDIEQVQRKKLKHVINTTPAVINSCKKNIDNSISTVTGGGNNSTFAE